MAIFEGNYLQSIQWKQHLKKSQESEKSETDFSSFLSAAFLASLTAQKRKILFRNLQSEQFKIIFQDWKFWARQSQIAPNWNWRTWLFLGGRGAGKTRAAAEWVRSAVETGIAQNIALIGTTYKDTMDIMVHRNYE